MGNRKTYITNQIVKYSTKLDQKGFVANHDGNISAKYEDVILATPTAVSKADISTDMIITLDLEGKKIEGIGKPFSEIELHLAAYNAREDAKAVIHAHPPYATARGLVGTSLTPSLPEAIVSIGNSIPVVEFVMPGSKENERIISEVLQKVDAFIMPGNGVLTIGDNLEQAYLRLELVEHLCKIHAYAERMGNAMSLRQEDIDKLLEKRTKAGLGPKAKKTEDTEFDTLKEMIKEEIALVLRTE